jgi:hypothetical protein
MVMIFTLSYIGYDIHSLIIKPYRTFIVIVLVVIFILWYVGKNIEGRLNRGTENDNNGEIDRRRG